MVVKGSLPLRHLKTSKHQRLADCQENSNLIKQQLFTASISSNSKKE